MLITASKFHTHRAKRWLKYQKTTFRTMRSNITLFKMLVMSGSWRKVLSVRRRDKWALSSSTIFNAGSFKTSGLVRLALGCTMHLQTPCQSFPKCAAWPARQRPCLSVLIASHRHHSMEAILRPDCRICLEVGDGARKALHKDSNSSVEGAPSSRRSFAASGPLPITCLRSTFRLGTCTPNAVGTNFEVIVLLQMSLFLLTKLDFCFAEFLQKRLCDSCHLQTFGGISVFFFLQETLHVHKIPRFGGGLLGLGGEGGFWVLFLGAGIF